MCDVMDCSVDLSRTRNKEDKKKGKDSWQRLGNKYSSMDTKERRIKKIPRVLDTEIKGLRCLLLFYVGDYFSFYFSERKRRRDGHQSRENEPRLLYNIRVCVCALYCYYLFLVNDGFSVCVRKQEENTHTHTHIQALFKFFFFLFSLFFHPPMMYNNKVCSLPIVFHAAEIFSFFVSLSKCAFGRTSGGFSLGF